MTERYALLSVSDKTGIETVARALDRAGVKLLSTGGTYEAIKAADIPVATVESVTDFPEMMDGRVKTLHPKVHGGLLADRSKPDHLAAMKSHDIPAIDFVIVNLYPFKETIETAGTTFAEAIEQIDIGGPTMLRSSAKNHAHVTVVTDPRDYETLTAQLAETGETTPAFRRYLAQKVFQLTAHYDALIAAYLDRQEETADDFSRHDWDHLTLAYDDKQSLRYGENSHQVANYYREVGAPAFSLAAAEQLHGKAMSYNNYNDADAALRISREFDEPCAVAVKHMNPCGVAIGETIAEAFDRCYSADPVSIFGGIVVLNRPVTLEVAEKLHEIFLEIVIAPEFEADALELLSRKKNIRLLTVDFSQKDESYEAEYRSIIGGLLEQDMDRSDELPGEMPAEGLPVDWTVMTDKQPTTAEQEAMNFGMKIAKHVKSNAIVINNDHMTLGIGAGQMNRVGAAEIALKQAAAREDFDASTAVMSSDAFFPMDDTVALARDYDVTAVVQPGGSIRDQDSVDYCNAHDMTMVKTERRHFRH